MIGFDSNGVGSYTLNSIYISAAATVVTGICPNLVIYGAISITDGVISNSRSSAA